MSIAERVIPPNGQRTGPLYERRIDPGTPVRVNIDPPSKLSPAPPKTPMVMTPKRLTR